MITKIFLEDVKIYAYHGVLPEERKIGTYFLVNAEIGYDFAEAIASDRLENTISYAEVNRIIHEEMEISSILIEHVAGRIFNRIRNEFPKIQSLKIKITKTNPPMKGELYGASVEIEEVFE